MITIITPSIRPEFLRQVQESLEKQTFKDFEWLVEIGFPSKHTYSSDVNKLLRKARGEKIVIWQDAISCESNFLEEVDKLPYKDVCWTFPVIKEGQKDWRTRGWEGNNAISKIQPHYWETDLAMAPTKAFFDVGGFDEDFDKGWSWDNVEIAWRLSAASYSFYVHPHLHGQAIDHDKILEHPFRNKLPNNDKRANETARKAERGIYKLDYLL